MASWNRNISLRALHAFCAAARNESFRKAAEELFLTSSAVSHQIKHLESEFGNKLFSRSSRSLQLTKSGQALFDELQPVLHDLYAVTARHTQRSARHSLRISVQPFFASELFVPRLQDFVAEHPEIDITIDTSDETPEKHPNSADVSIRLFRSPPKFLSCDRLFSLCLVPAGSPTFYDRIKVVSGRIVSSVHESRPKAWSQWEKIARMRIPSGATTIRFDSMIAVARAAERGMGAALVPLQLGHVQAMGVTKLQGSMMRNICSCS
jgi:LysR family glycine cleavage system transcriptional activator